MAKKSTNKRRTRSQLEKELDRVFSIFIRMRDSNEDGDAVCFTCGKSDKWVNMDNGHYISRVHRSTRWNELNCHVQCKRCNIFMHGNYPIYALNLTRVFGAGVLEELSALKNTIAKISTPEMEAMIKHYRDINGQKMS
jgi:hypothetical protein